MTSIDEPQAAVSRPRPSGSPGLSRIRSATMAAARRRRRAAALSAVAAAALAVSVTAVAAAGPALAAKSPAITVCPSGCDYTAIQDAINAAPSGGTITIAAGTYAGGLTVHKNLTLVGAGASQTTISGGFVPIAIYVATVTISGVTFSGGTDNYGAVETNFATMTLRHCVVSGNTTGIGNLNGTMTLDDTTVSDNSERFVGAGGIYNSGGTLTLDHSTVSGNTASVDGGGILNFGTVTLNHSTVSGNTAGTDGGGIYSTSGTVNGAVAGVNVFGNQPDIVSM